MPIEVFKSSNIQKLLDLKIDWLTKLTYLQNVNEIEEILDIVPAEIKEELEKIADLARDISYENIVISPLYYSKMNYYDGLFFRYIEGNSVLGMGGCYEYEDMEATGFALYVDKLIEEKLKDE
jgi:histidyl-tRNA synthetase